MSEYRPAMQWQLDDTLYPGASCNLNAVGMAVDKDSLGLVVPNPDRLRRALLPDKDGTTMEQGLWAIERVYGWTLDYRHVTVAQLRGMLADGAGAVIHIVRQPIGNLCGHTFDGTHAVYGQGFQPPSPRYLLGDTLCQSLRWVDADALEAAGLAFGALVGQVGRIRVALTRRDRIRPAVRVTGRFFRYAEPVKGRSLSRQAYGSRHTRWSATTESPENILYVPDGSWRRLVQVSDPQSAYDGWWVEPKAGVVHFTGEL